MKRDLDLVRDILLKSETYNDNPPMYPESFSDLNSNQDVINYHLLLLHQAGFIDAYDVSTLGRRYKQYAVQNLTFAGCDYLDSVRDKDIWDTVKSKLQSVGSSATIEVVKALANSVIQQQLGL